MATYPILTDQLLAEYKASGKKVLTLIMRKLVLFISILITCVCRTYALDVDFKSQSFNGVSYLIVITDSDDDKVVVEPMAIKFFLRDESTYILDNSKSTKYDKSGPGMIYGTHDRSKHYYRFEITQELIDALQKGAKGFILNTIPELYYEGLTETESNNLLKKLTEPDYIDNRDF